jgi:hypothetical protein
MKEANFNYITINSVGKELNDKLVAGFAKSGLKSKSSYLTQVLSRGLEAEAICESVSDPSKADAILSEIKGLRGDLSALSAQLFESAAGTRPTRRPSARPSGCSCSSRTT